MHLFVLEGGVQLPFQKEKKKTGQEQPDQEQHEKKK
jgi:hypothetical protein